MTHDGGLLHAHGDDESGWTWHNVEGWSAFDVWVRAVVANGSPAVLGFRVEAQPGAEVEPVTIARLRSLPLAELATLSVEKSQLARPALDVRTAAARLQYGQPAGEPSREAEVAAVWLDSYDRGTGATPREAVMQHFHLSERTADRMIARARQLGYITAPLRGGRAPRKVTTGNTRRTK